MEKKKVIVYVDGFNFYYGLKHGKWRKYYWLDIVRFFGLFLRYDQELVEVKYFSARPFDIEKSKDKMHFSKPTRKTKNSS